MIQAGVLSVQGDVEEHLAVLRRAIELTEIEASAAPVKTIEDIASCDCLVIPGGESTAIGKHIMESEAYDLIVKRAKEGMPILGTCAGMILLSRHGDGHVEKTKQKLLGLMDVKVNRNAFGRQHESFETEVEVTFLGLPKFRALFIRAPIIEEVGGKDIEVIARLPDETIVGIRKGNLIGLSFHPELSGDTRIHEHLLQRAFEWQKKSEPHDEASPLGFRKRKNPVWKKASAEL